MPRIVWIAGLTFALGGCAQLLGVDDVSYVGGDAAADVVDALADVPDVVTPDAADATPACDGGCKPTTLVSEAGVLPTLATNGSFVFFRTNDTVWSCPTTGCANATFVATTATGGLQTVAAASNVVVWTEGSHVFGCAPGACNIPTTYIDFNPNPVTGLAASTLSNFVLASGGVANALAVHRITLAGQADTIVFSGNPGGGTPGPVTAMPSSPHVYWSQTGTPQLYDCVQTQCGATADHNAGVVASPIALVATTQSLFVATLSGLFIAPANLGTPQTFFGGATVGVTTTTSSLARVYFAAGTTIQSCGATETPPCKPITHHTGGAAITAIAADDVALYWIEGSAIMRLAL